MIAVLVCKAVRKWHTLNSAEYRFFGVSGKRELFSGFRFGDICRKARGNGHIVALHVCEGLCRIQMRHYDCIRRVL